MDDGAGGEPGGWGLDFGTRDTVLARHDPTTGAATAVRVPAHGRPDDEDAVPTVPSVIHYADDGRRLVGQEVLDADLLDAPGTAHGTASSIGRRSPEAVQVGDRRISLPEAGADLLAAVLHAAGGAGGAGPVALAVPVEALERYEGWLRQVADAAGLPRIRLVDEPSAAAVGYGLALRPGQVLVLVDCAAGSVRAAVVRVTDDAGSEAGRACRVLGSADDDGGGDDALDRVLRAALRGAAERGYEADDVADVLVVGGAGADPSVRDTIGRVAGGARVHADRPRDALACGAATLAAGAGSAGRIEHDYALRRWDRARGRYEFRTCVPAGTAYPTEEPVATVVLKATHDGQRELGVAVFELGEAGSDVRSELVLDRSGGWRLEALTPVDEQTRTRVWVNELDPTYLVADPPAQAGEARFRVELAVDAGKRLVLTAHDLVSRETVLRDHPVADLR